MTKNILLAVSGLSPQVITETLYALFMEGKPVHEVHVITTRTGRENIFQSLLSPRGPFDCFLDEYNIPRESINFTPENIHIIRDKNDIPLDDITDLESNEALLKVCLEVTFSFTTEKNKSVFFLLAGGRKTMSGCLAIAAQFYGRPQDRVYHVLVSPEFESSRDFWFPPKKSQIITLYDQKGQPFQKETRFAEIQLVSMPFVSVRKYLATDMLDGPRRPADLMSSLVKEEYPSLIVSLSQAKLIYGEQEVDVNPAYLAVYAWFAEKKKNCKSEQNCGRCRECFIDSVEIMDDSHGLQRLYSYISGSRTISEMSDTGISCLTRENFNSYKSKLRNLIENGFGSIMAKDLVISSIGSKPDTRFGILLDKSRIRIEW